MGGPGSGRHKGFSLPKHPLITSIFRRARFVTKNIKLHEHAGYDYKDARKLARNDLAITLRNIRNNK